MGPLQQDREPCEMKKSLGEKGFIRGLLGLFLLVALVYALVIFSRPYYRYYALGSHTRDFLKTDIGDIAAIRKNVMKDAGEIGVPLDDADLSVTIDKKIVKIKASWTDTVDVLGFYQKSMDFEMEEVY
jgi:hypothetical protein